MTERRGGGGLTKVTECRMTYVALDDDRRPVSVR
jgi:acyl-CoA hydrolase